MSANRNADKLENNQKRAQQQLKRGMQFWQD